MKAAIAVTGSPMERESAAIRPGQVLPTTRWLGGIIVPFLVVASVILWVWPERTGNLFAWPIKPSMTAMMLAAAYVGGIYFFVRVVGARRWHHIKIGFPPVAAFASLLGLATALHWNRFTPGHVSFWAWAGLYFTTPFLVIGAYLANRGADDGTREADDPMIPEWLRGLLRLSGLLVMAISLLLFVAPSFMIPLWPWRLSPLTARVMSAMFALPGVVFYGIGSDGRWSAARIILEAQLCSITVILIAAARSRADFAPIGVAGFLFIGGLAAMWLGLLSLYLAMDAQRLALAK